MKTQAALAHEPMEDRLEVPNLRDYKEEKIRAILDAVVHVKGCGTKGSMIEKRRKMKMELFS
jgi:hypothetical protein